MAIGVIGGIIVGLTSVGSGSLMIILLLFLYPTIGAKQLVGTDLAQAVPLTAAAALGALAFGHVEFGVTTSLIIGSVPAVLVGSMLSSSAPDRYIRPVITFVDRRLGPEVRRRRHHRARLDPVRDPVRRRRRLAAAHTAVARHELAARHARDRAHGRPDRAARERLRARAPRARSSATFALDVCCI